MNDQQKVEEVAMPGAWICDKCGFILQKNVLHTLDGSISANVADHCEGCPNDGLPMRAFTWREANESLYKRATELLAESAAKDAEIERLNGILLMKTPWPLPDILRKLSEAADILMVEKDYDGHGHEQISAAARAANIWLLTHNPKPT